MDLISLNACRLTLPSQAGDVEILRGIDLDIRAGEQVAIVGPSGSGKSSLLMILAGLERATSGQVSVLGADLNAMGEDALAELRRGRIGIVFQAFHLIPTMTALENIATPLEIAGGADAFGRAEAMLGEVGLADRADHYPVQLSGGEQQRVALARALVTGPELLLADEPTGNLDGATGTQVTDLLFRLAESHGATLVMVTHAMALAEACARIVRMDSGRIESDQTRIAAA